MVQHKAPHRNWMPALRHLSYMTMLRFLNHLLFLISGRTMQCTRSKVGIDRHMDLNYDLFVDLTPDFNQPPSQKRQDRSAWHNSKECLPTTRGMEITMLLEIKLFDAKLAEKTLFVGNSRYAKNYLRCMKGVDESVDRLQKN